MRTEGQMAHSPSSRANKKGHVMCIWNANQENRVCLAGTWTGLGRRSMHSLRMYGRSLRRPPSFQVQDKCHYRRSALGHYRYLLGEQTCTTKPRLTKPYTHARDCLRTFCKQGIQFESDSSALSCSPVRQHNPENVRSRAVTMRYEKLYRYSEPDLSISLRYTVKNASPITCNVTKADIHHSKITIAMRS